MYEEVQNSNVSRETFENLAKFHDLLVKWNTKINLVSKSSIEELWDRHIWDSAQLVSYISGSRIWVDIGSGGGFPGLVVAIFALELNPKMQTILVESDQRKSVFLRTAIRDLSLNAKVRSDRIEEIDPIGCDVLSARALADLSQLLRYTERHLAPNGTAVFLKGENWKKEVQSARESWSFSLNTHKSKSNARAAVLEIKEIQRV